MRADVPAQKKGGKKPRTLDHVWKYSHKLMKYSFLVLSTEMIWELTAAMNTSSQHLDLGCCFFLLIVIKDT